MEKLMKKGFAFPKKWFRNLITCENCDNRLKVDWLKVVDIVAAELWLQTPTNWPNHATICLLFTTCSLFRSLQNAASRMQSRIFWFLFEYRMKQTGWHDLSSGDMKIRRQTKLKGGAHFSLLSDSEGYFDKNHRGLYCHPSQDQVEVIPIYLRVILPDIDFWIQNYLLDINQPG